MNIDKLITVVTNINNNSARKEVTAVIQPTSNL